MRELAMLPGARREQDQFDKLRQRIETIAEAALTGSGIQSDGVTRLAFGLNTVVDQAERELKMALMLKKQKAKLAGKTSEQEILTDQEILQAVQKVIDDGALRRRV